MLSADDRLAIEALHAAWLDAELRGDASVLLQFCTADPVGLPPDEPPLCGREAIRRWLDDQPRTTVLRIDIDDLEISGIGSFAYKLANFRAAVAGPAGERIVAGSHGWLLQRVGGWRIAVVTWTIAETART